MSNANVKADLKNTPRVKRRGSSKINMCEGPIFPLLVRFAIPVLVTGVLQVLFNAADIMVVGQFGSQHSLAAVSSTGSITALIVNLFIGLTAGSTVLCARFFGAGDKKALSETVHTSMYISVIIGVVLGIFGMLFSESLLAMMGVPQEVLPLAALYMRIYFIGVIPSLIYNFAASILRSVGDTKRPMYILTSAGVINVVLNLIFVIALKMDVAGVALATVISQLFSAVLTVACLMKESDDIRLCISKLRITTRRLWQIIAIGLPSGLHSTMFSLANVVVQSSINSFGPAVMAGSGASSSIESLLFTSLSSISQAIVAFTSQNFGKYNYKRIVKAHLIGQGITYTFGLALCLLAVGFAGPLISLYADGAEEIAAGVAKLQMIGILVFVYNSSDIAIATMRGIGSSLAPTITSVFSVCGVRLLWISTIFQTPQFHTVSWLYMVFPISYVLSLVAQMTCMIILLRRVKKRYPAPIIPAT